MQTAILVILGLVFIIFGYWLGVLPVTMIVKLVQLVVPLAHSY